MKRLLAIALLLVSSTAMADLQLISTGTAFVVNKNYAVTAAHVLEDCDRATIRHKHKEIDTDIAAVDSTNEDPQQVSFFCRNEQRCRQKKVKTHRKMNII